MGNGRTVLARWVDGVEGEAGVVTEMWSDNGATRVAVISYTVVQAPLIGPDVNDWLQNGTLPKQ